jgi:hypothetical protein
MPVVHEPPEATPQRVSHAPQWFASVCSFTHVPPQLVCPVGHWHIPATHIAPIAQTLPHVPQLVRSVCRLMQSPPHMLEPVGHEHTPDAHVPAPPHMRPHAPQLFTSVATFTHWPRQAI